MIPLFLVMLSFSKVHTVSPRWLVEAAYEKSDTAQRIRTTAQGLESSRLRFESRFSPKLGVTVYHDRNALESSSAFVGEATHRRLTIEWSKAFTSGTQLSAQIFSDGADDQVVSLGSSGLEIGDSTYNEIRAGALLRQSLWANGFGRDDRSDLRALASDRQGAEFSARTSLEDYTLALIDRYYQAWRLFRSRPIYEERFARESERIRVFKRQFDRGFLDPTDILQLESSSLSAENRLDEIRSEIERTLIRLGHEIKMDLTGLSRSKVIRIEDESVEDMLARCKKAENYTSFETQASQTKVEAAQARIDSARGRNRPELFLDAQFYSNSIGSSETQNFENSLKARRSRFYIGLGFEYRFGDTEHDAQLIEASKALQDAKIALNQSLTDVQRETDVNCRELLSIRNRVRRMNKKQKLEREMVLRLDKKYQVGKVDLNTLFAAENTLEQTQLEKIQLNARMFQLAWSIRRTTGGLSEMIGGFFK